MKRSESIRKRIRDRDEHPEASYEALRRHPEALRKHPEDRSVRFTFS